MAHSLWIVSHNEITCGCSPVPANERRRADTIPLSTNIAMAWFRRNGRNVDVNGALDDRRLRLLGGLYQPVLHRAIQVRLGTAQGIADVGGEEHADPLDMIVELTVGEYGGD